MTLVDLIKQLKAEFKTNGDRELRADVTVLAILSPYAPEPPAPVVYTDTTATTNKPVSKEVSDAEYRAEAQRLGRDSRRGAGK